VNDNAVNATRHPSSGNSHNKSHPARALLSPLTSTADFVRWFQPGEVMADDFFDSIPDDIFEGIPDN